MRTSSATTERSDGTRGLAAGTAYRLTCPWRQRLLPAPSTEFSHPMTVSTRRRARRDRRERRGASQEVQRLSWRTVRNPHPPARVLSEDQVEAIHEASIRVLCDIGMKVLSPRARAHYAGAGASADDDSAMVRFDPAMIEEYMALAPPSYTIKARNPEEDAHLRRQRHQLRAGRRAVLRLRSRPRPPRRGLRGLPQLHEAVVLVRHHPSGRCRPAGAARTAGHDPSPGPVLRRDHAARQGLGRVVARRVPGA